MHLREFSSLRWRRSRVLAHRRPVSILGLFVEKSGCRAACFADHDPRKRDSNCRPEWRNDRGVASGSSLRCHQCPAWFRRHLRSGRCNQEATAARHRPACLGFALGWLWPRCHAAGASQRSDAVLPSGDRKSVRGHCGRCDRRDGSEDGAGREDVVEWQRGCRHRRLREYRHGVGAVRSAVGASHHTSQGPLRSSEGAGSKRVGRAEIDVRDGLPCAVGLIDWFVRQR